MGYDLSDSGLRSLDNSGFLVDDYEQKGLEMAYARVKISAEEMTRNEFLRRAGYGFECFDPANDKKGYCVQLTREDFRWFSVEAYEKRAHDRDLMDCSGDCFYNIRL